jgi:GNAT superfamily N-acetyltransferase
MGFDDSAARYDWLYGANPHGKAITWLAVERGSGEVVACKSLFPRAALVGGKPRVASIGGDCYVEPRARRRGLATRLHRTSFDEMARFGVDFLCGGLPNPENLAALLKAGSHHIATFDRWIFPLSLRTIYLSAALRGRVAAKLRSGACALAADLPGIVLRRLANRQTTREAVTLAPIREFGADFDHLFCAFAATQRIVLVRDRQYLAWRYLAAPHGIQKPVALRRGDGTLVGFAAVEIGDRRLSIIDVLAAPGWTGAALHALLGEAKRLRCGVVDLCCCAGSPLVAELSRFGFWKVPNCQFHVALSAKDAQFEALLDPRGWHFVMADNDSDVSTPR